MTDAEKLARAEGAKRILDDPLVIEALATIEAEIIEQFHACPTRDSEGMRILQSELRRARKFKILLQGAIQQGQLAAHDIREKETLLQRVQRF